MYHIKKVVIRGFWGKKTIQPKFHKDVNIIIGKNGTGKTTFILCLQAVLEVDVTLLYSLEFKSIEIELGYREQTISIIVTKKIQKKLFVETATYKIGDTPYEIPIYGKDAEERRYPLRVIREQKKLILEELSKLIKISTISVYRLPANEIGDDDEYFPRRKRGLIFPIETRLENLMMDLTRYQLKLSEKKAILSKDFQKDVLRSILYDKKYDSSEYTTEHLDDNIDLRNLKKDLTIAFTTLVGTLDSDFKKRINRHIDEIGKSINAVNKFRTNPTKNEFDIENYIPLSLYNRTLNIIDLLFKTDKNRKLISAPMDSFLEALGGFIIDKSIVENKEGGLEFIKNNKKLSIKDLSSGEKQILILLTETLLQEKRPFIFIADEPELSLHIEWQSKILQAIQEINPNTQIIVATHSPEIASGYPNSIINMGKLL